MQVVVTVAGLGQRFQVEGFAQPKPIVPVMGKAAITYLIESFSPKWELIFAIGEHYKNTDVEKVIKKSCPGAVIVYVPHSTRGPIDTVLAVLPLLNTKKSVAVSYCDYAMIWKPEAFETFLTETNCDVCIPVYKGFHPTYLGPNTYAHLQINEKTGQIHEGPPMINSENAMLRGTVLFNVRERDLGSTVQEAQKKLNTMINKMPKGYYLDWSGQYENLIRGERTLKMILPIVLVIIFMCMYFAFNSAREAFFSLISIPFALIGGAYFVYFWGVNLSVAVSVGFIALFGLAVETGIVMVIYLNDAMDQLIAKKGNSRETITKEDLREYVIHGAAKRLRPKLMTVSVSLFGLVPILWSTGVGSDVMIPIVLPMIGGVLTSSTHILLVTPLIFLMQKEYELRKHGKIDVLETKH